MRHLASLLVLGALIAPVAPLTTVAQEAVEKPEVIEEVVEEPEEIVEETVEEPEETIEELTETPVEPDEGFESAGEDTGLFSLFSLQSSIVLPEISSASIAGYPSYKYTEGIVSTKSVTQTALKTGNSFSMSLGLYYAQAPGSPITLPDSVTADLSVLGLGVVELDYNSAANTVRNRGYQKSGLVVGNATEGTHQIPFTVLFSDGSELVSTVSVTIDNTTPTLIITDLDYSDGATPAPGDQLLIDFTLDGTGSNVSVLAVLLYDLNADGSKMNSLYPTQYWYSGSGKVPEGLGAGTHVDIPLTLQDKSRPYASIAGFELKLVAYDNAGNQVIATTSISTTIEPEKPTVLFLPGFGASRLYTESGRQLWEPNGTDDFEDLAFKASPAAPLTVYVGDVIDQISPENIANLKFDHVHTAFLGWLEDLKASGQISAYQAYSYDWRYDVFDVIDDGTLRQDGSRDYLTDVVVTLEESGPVTIIAHSNGGLLAKALMVRLAELGEEDLVDRIIFIGVPQIGTPQAMLGLLHGDEIAKPFYTPTGVARTAAVTMPGAYALLPSETYFDNPHSVLAFFDEGVATDPYRALFGEEVTDLVTALAFWQDNSRGIPSEHDEETPYPLSASLLEKAQVTHGILDAWTAPASTDVYAIAGWGNDTASGAAYYTECTLFVVCSIDYDRERLDVVDGDNTVLAPSALYMGSGVYFDLFELQDDFGEEGKHQNLTESVYIHQYLENLLDFGTIYEQILFTLTEPSTDKFPEEKKTKTLSVHSPVILSVTDPEGNQSGIFPLEGTDIYYILEDIPDSSVTITGEDKYVSVPSDDEYEVTITGIGSGTFTFQVEEYDDEELISDSSITDIPVTDETIASLTISDQEEVASPLELDKDGDGAPEVTVAFHENEAVMYEEPTTEDENSNGSGGGSSRRTKSSTQTDERAEELPEQRVQLWPNPYLLPPSPFTPVEEQETVFETVTEQSEVPDVQEPAQTAAVYDAIRASLAWLTNTVRSFFSWISGLIGWK